MAVKKPSVALLLCTYFMVTLCMEKGSWGKISAYLKTFAMFRVTYFVH